jgi:hypothetical protein
MPDLAAHEKIGDVMTAIESDAELQAMRTVLGALVPLKLEGRTRVLGYVLNRLGMSSDVAVPATSGTIYTSPGSGVTSQEHDVQIVDIRSLKEKKSPRSANEMAAIVAYYLSELAPERKQSINTDDIKKYFLEARFPLPTNLQMLLVNAKNSGYLQSAGSGQYRLNSVGYNLVTHKLPVPAATSTQTKSRLHKVKKRAGKKSPRG